MKKAELLMDNYPYEFYRKVGAMAGKSAEEAMSDALFRFAGESSLWAIDKKERGR